MTERESLIVGSVGWLEPTFVEGIGPPLEQLEEDNREALVLSGTEPRHHLDALALIAEVKKLRAKIAEHETALCQAQDVDVNYYVLVPFSTGEAAKWAAGDISVSLDCFVVSTAAVDQEALIIESFPS